MLGREHRVVAAVQVADAMEPFDNQRQAEEQPVDQDAVGVVVAEVLESLAVLGLVEALVFDLPPVLSVAGNPDCRPVECLPGIEIVGAPDLHPVLSVADRRSPNTNARGPNCFTKFPVDPSPAFAVAAASRTAAITSPTVAAGKKWTPSCRSSSPSGIRPANSIWRR